MLGMPPRQASALVRLRLEQLSILGAWLEDGAAQHKAAARVSRRLTALTLRSGGAKGLDRYLA
jgi:hypothetical protein